MVFFCYSSSRRLRQFPQLDLSLSRTQPLRVEVNVMGIWTRRLEHLLRRFLYLLKCTAKLFYERIELVQSIGRNLKLYMSLLTSLLTLVIIIILNKLRIFEHTALWFFSLFIYNCFPLPIILCSSINWAASNASYN